MLYQALIGSDLTVRCNYRNLMTIVCKYLIHSAIIHVHVAVQVEIPASVMGSADQILCCVRLKVTVQKHCL